MGKMYLMCGLAGVGKTTFAKEVAENEGLTYLGIDDFYKPFYENDKTAYDKEEIAFRVWIKFYEAIFEAEMRGDDVIIDTNAPTFVKRVQFIDWFGKFDEHNLIYIMINDVNTQVQNNANRNRVVPTAELLRMQKEFEEPIARVRDGVFKAGDRGKWDNIFVWENVNNTMKKWKEE